MMSYSPLRYPGGKAKLTPYVLETLMANNLVGTTYVEPFAGGAAIAWYLLLNNHVKHVFINDLDPSIYSLWECILNRSEEFCERIRETPITMDEWYKQKEIQNKGDADIIDLGFSTLFLNRTNRSGIISAGVIGGYNQMGNYKIDCRFNRDRLISQIKAIAAKRNNVTLTNLDAVEFIDEIIPSIQGDALVNIDPPYYVKGKRLYKNYFKHEDHCRLFNSVRNIEKHWIVTYDDTPEINDIYSEFSPEPFGLAYSVQEKRTGTEVIIHKPETIKAKIKPDTTFNQLRKLKLSGSYEQPAGLQ